MKTRHSRMTPVKDLYFGMTDVKPVDFDWTQGYPEKWDYFAASRCEKCGEIVVGRGDEQHCDLDSDSECDGWIPLNEGPMMSYYYPLPQYDGDCTDAAKLLVDLPLVVVEFQDSGDKALALSGGGMDLSWQICEAYMLLGYLPPVHFCDLPEMAGRGQSAKDRWIIAGCRRSLQGAKHRAGSSLRRLRERFKKEGK